MSKLIIISLLCFICSLNLEAEKTESTQIPMWNKDRHKNDRPRAPQRHSTVDCFYQDGVITIEFEIPEGDAVLTVTDVVTGDNASTTFNTAMGFNYFIGSEPSTYLLEISTSAGNDYEGYLTID